MEIRGQWAVGWAKGCRVRPKAFMGRSDGWPEADAENGS